MDLSHKDSEEESQKSSESSSLQISDLPEEILEYILIHLSPYRDLKCAMSVNRQWYRLVQGILTIICTVFMVFKIIVDEQMQLHHEGIFYIIDTCF